MVPASDKERPVCRLAEPMLQELQQIASSAELAAGPPGPGLVSLGNTILHILQAVTSIVLPAARDPSAIMPLSLLTRRRVPPPQMHHLAGAADAAPGRAAGSRGACAGPDHCLLHQDCTCWEEAVRAISTKCSYGHTGTVWV